MPLLSRRNMLRCVAWLGAAIGLPAPANARVPVDLQLMLAIDCSYSVDAGEFNLQRRGIAAALLDPEIQQAIAFGPNRAVAIAVMQWSSEQSQVMAIPWTRIDGPAACQALAARVLQSPRMTQDGGTSISAAIRFAILSIERAPFTAVRKIIDISGDGRSNNGPQVGLFRDRAVARGITVNALAILHEDRTLDIYYRRRVIGGHGAFVEVANDYSAYREAIRRKMLREISYVPVSMLKAGGPATTEPRGRSAEMAEN